MQGDDIAQYISYRACIHLFEFLPFTFLIARVILLTKGCIPPVPRSFFGRPQVTLPHGPNGARFLHVLGLRKTITITNALLLIAPTS